MHGLFLTLTGVGVGFMVGLTGIGGGALMTPILVLVFGVDPLTAVSSDLVASLVMKPVGSAVHLKRGAVHRRLVLWLSIGSVPAAFSGVLILRALGDGAEVQSTLKHVLGVALLLAVGGIALKARVSRRNAGGPPRLDAHPPVRIAATLAVGVFGGLMVGLTSVGSGSLMIVALMLLYPSLETRALVGTDLVQAIPLVGSAAFGHLLFGDVEFGLAGALLLGALPGVYLGARISSRASSPLVRPALVVLLILSASKLLGADNTQLAVLVALLAAAGGVLLYSRSRTGVLVGAVSPEGSS